MYNQFNPPLLFYGNKNLKSYNLTIEENHPEDILLAVKELNENFNNKNWLNSIKKRRTFVTKKSKNLYCNNRIPLPKMFINKYKKLVKLIACIKVLVINFYRKQFLFVID